MVEIEFTKPYVNKKKGDKAFYDCQIASYLIRSEKVAKIVKAKK